MRGFKAGKDEAPRFASSPGGREKVHKVMGEFKRKKLKSSSGKKVKSRKQALAIAMSEAGMSKKKGGK